MACLKIRRNNLGLLPRGVQMMMPITERDRHEPDETMTGVCPLGAQVRLTLAFCEKPDSSQKANYAPIRRAFF